MVNSRKNKRRIIVELAIESSIILALSFARALIAYPNYHKKICHFLNSDSLF